MSDNTVTRLGVLPDNWGAIRLRDGAKIGSGKSPEYKANGLGQFDVVGSNGKIGSTDRMNFESGIAVGRVGASGAVHQIKRPVWLSDNVLFVKPNPSIWNESFLYHTLMMARLPALASQTAQPLLTQTKLGAIFLPVPPLEEQINIAETLDSADIAIEKTEDLITKTEQLRDALLHELLTRGFPGHHTEWKEVCIDEIAFLRKNKITPTRDDSSPYIGLEHMESGGGLLGFGEARYTTSQKTRFLMGDILYGKLRPNLKKVIRADFGGVCSTDILVINAYNDIDTRFVGWVLRSEPFYKFSLQGITGTKMPRTSWDHISGFRLRWPVLKERASIVNAVERIDKVVQINKDKLQKLENLKITISNCLLSGMR